MFEKHKYVYAVYKEGNFTRAAQKLFISQPSLSVAIKNVEAEIGAPIFERCGSGVTLTEVGREYISAAERIMSIEKDFEKRVEDIYGLEVGNITVGGTNYLSSYVLPKIITKFSALYPKIKVTLVEENSRTLDEMMRNEELDVMIDSFDHPDGVYEAYPLANEHILLCVPEELEVNAALEKYQVSASSVADGKAFCTEIASVSIDSFKNENFILLKSGNDMYDRAMRIFDGGNVVPTVLFSVDQLNISFALAESGIGICFVTDTLIRYGRVGKGIRLYKIKEDSAKRTLYIAYKKSRYCTSVMRRFIDVAREVINDSKTKL